jgi:hypothetical protein
MEDDIGKGNEHAYCRTGARDDGCERVESEVPNEWNDIWPVGVVGWADGF